MTIELAASLAALDPRTRAVPASLRHVTNRVGIANQKSGTQTRSGWRSWQMSHVPLVALRVVTWNGFVSSNTAGVETGCGSTQTLALSVEYPRGTFTRITAQNGGLTNTIADNEIGSSDLFVLPTPIPAYAWFRICGDTQMAAGGTVPSCGWTNSCDRGMGDEYQVGTTADQTLNNTVLGTGLANAVFPQLVLGMSDRRVWGVVGDSIAAGINDAVFSPSGGRGMFGRALAKSGPHINFGVPGDRATYYIASHAKRLALMQIAGVSDVMLQLGINDFGAGRTSANLQADRTTIRGYFPDANVYDATVTPSSTSTDSYKTAATQTAVASTSERTAFNDVLRNARPATSNGLVDVASMIETSPANEFGPVVNGGVWVPGTTIDGLHPNSRGYQRLVDPVAELLSVLR